MNALPPSELAGRLHAAGILVPTAASGVYAMDARFTRVVQAVGAAVRAEAGAVESMRFPPVMARGDLQRLGYFRNFPHLLGAVYSFCGDDHAHRALMGAHDRGGDWSGGDQPSDLVLAPAACYPLYPMLAARGPLPLEGYTAEVLGACFRREPSVDPVRMQSFTMQEIVHVGSPKSTAAFRDGWMDRARRLLESWGLQTTAEAANDPFFGRAGVVMSRAQRAQTLKVELRVVVTSEAAPTACVSVNSHLDGFTRTSGLSLADGDLAHSACIGFGLERTALALFRVHGLDPARWPPSVRIALGLS